MLDEAKMAKAGAPHEPHNGPRNKQMSIFLYSLYTEGISSELNLLRAEARVTSARGFMTRQNM